MDHCTYSTQGIFGGARPLQSAASSIASAGEGALGGEGSKASERPCRILFVLWLVGLSPPGGLSPRVTMDPPRGVLSQAARHGTFGMDMLVVVGTTVSYLYSTMSLILACFLRAGEGAHGMGRAAGHPHLFLESPAMLLTFVTLGEPWVGRTLVAGRCEPFSTMSVIVVLHVGVEVSTRGTGMGCVEPPPSPLFACPFCLLRDDSKLFTHFY